MLLIAHRGLVTDSIKENTIKAFDEALKSSKYYGIELDVRETKDKVFVVYHDLLYKGKLIKNCLYKELKNDDIPKLIDVLKLDTNKIIMIEIKGVNLNLRRLAKLLNNFNYKKLYISSFNNKVLLEIKKYLKNIKVGVLNYVLNSTNDYERFDFVCIINNILTKDLVNYFRRKEIEVFGYGIKDINKIKFSNIYYIVDDEITLK